MNQNQAAAFIAAQAAILNCRVEALKAENQYRMACGHSPAYGEEAFRSVEVDFDPVISYNAIMQLYQNCER